jgi:hypothetical protein
MFTDGLKFQPDSIELRVEMVRTLAELKQAEQTINLMKQLPAGALTDAEQDLLRGRMLAILGQWDEARRLAAVVLKERFGARQVAALVLALCGVAIMTAPEYLSTALALSGWLR